MKNQKAEQHNTTEFVWAVRDDRNIPNGYHKTVLIMLYSHGENIYPTQQQLLKECGIGSKNTLKKVIEELEELGYVLVIRGERHGRGVFANNRYQVVYPPLDVHSPNMTLPETIYDNTVDHI